MVSHPNRRRSPGHTVTLVRGRSGFANVPDKFIVMQPGYIADETCESIEDYYLPDGYKVAQNRIEMLTIYDPNDEHCEIVPHSSGRPQLIAGGRDMPILKRKVAA